MKLKVRRVSVVMLALIGVAIWLVVNPASYDEIFTRVENTGAESGIRDRVDESFSNTNDESDDGSNGGSDENDDRLLAVEVLEKLEVKGRAPKKGYTREQFYDGWPLIDGCSLRQKILKREFGETAVLDGCNVVAGEYDEPYTGEHMIFTERNEVSELQIDHVVALSDAWQKGAQELSVDERNTLATDPLNLLAVDGAANKQKSDGDAATWLPKNKKFRCQYVARQVSVKYKYRLWVTQAEKEAISRILTNCPNERAIGITK